MGLETILRATKNFGKDLIKYGTLYTLGIDEAIIKSKRCMPRYIKNTWEALVDLEYTSIFYMPITGMVLYNDLLIGKTTFISMFTGGFLGLIDALARLDNKKDKFEDGYGAGLMGKMKGCIKR